MRALIQRVKRASVTVDCEVTGQIGPGLLVFLGISREDRLEDTKWLADKVSCLRIFPDEADKMNLNVRDVGGEILVVSQFTLYGDCNQGRRPDFGPTAPPQVAEPIYEKFVAELGVAKTGKFGAKMEVTLVNDGPVTFLVETKKV